MQHDAETADLVLVIGTSLGGLNADQVATSTAHRSRIALPYMADGRGGALGTVCINLQQTAEDGKMTLRMFGKSDAVLKQLVAELGLGKVPTRLHRWPSITKAGRNVSRALVPYDAEGKRLPEGSNAKHMWLDLSDRQKIRLTKGHNVQGAKQPMYMHIGARRATKYKGVRRDPCAGVGTVCAARKCTLPWGSRALPCAWAYGGWTPQCAGQCPCCRS